MQRPLTRNGEPGSARPASEERDGLLRLVLKLDAVASGALGVLSLAAASVLDDLLGAPLTLLAPVGVFLVAWAAVLWMIASRIRISKPAASAVILFNLVWVLDSAVVVSADFFSLTGLGTAFVLFQAAAVLFFALAQFYALRLVGRGRDA